MAYFYVWFYCLWFLLILGICNVSIFLAGETPFPFLAVAFWILEIFSLPFEGYFGCGDMVFMVPCLLKCFDKLQKNGTDVVPLPVILDQVTLPTLPTENTVSFFLFWLFTRSFIVFPFTFRSTVHLEAGVLHGSLAPRPGPTQQPNNSLGRNAAPHISRQAA